MEEQLSDYYKLAKTEKNTAGYKERKLRPSGDPGGRNSVLQHSHPTQELTGNRRVSPLKRRPGSAWPRREGHATPSLDPQIRPHKAVDKSPADSSNSLSSIPPSAKEPGRMSRQHCTEPTELPFSFLKKHHFRFQGISVSPPISRHEGRGVADSPHFRFSVGTARRKRRKGVGLYENRIRK